MLARPSGLPKRPVRGERLLILHLQVVVFRASGFAGCGAICRLSQFVAVTTHAEVPMMSEEQAKLVEWMDEATGATLERAGGVLNVTRFADAFWYLTQPIEWTPDDPGQGLPT